MGLNKWSPQTVPSGVKRLSKGLRLGRGSQQKGGKVQGTLAWRLEAAGMVWGYEAPMHMFLLGLSTEHKP